MAWRKLVETENGWLTLFNHPFFCAIISYAETMPI